MIKSFQDKKKFKIKEKHFYLNQTNIIKNYLQNLSKMFSWMKIYNFKKKNIIFDIGANEGVFSIAYAMLFLNSKIYSFEPVNFTYLNLLNNIKFNKLEKNILPYKIGLGDENENVKLAMLNKSQLKKFYNKKNVNSGLYSAFGKSKKKFNANF